MQRLFAASVTATAILMSGCTTASFAPPAVDLYREMDSTSLGPTCKLTGSDGKAGTPLQPVTPDLAGARILIKNYYATYNCAMRASANGRQWFEIPAFAALIGATGAVALGAGRNVAFVGQSANSVFTAGNKYYAPQEQVSILRSAVDAITCIESEASQIDAYQATVAASAQRGTAAALAGGGPTITVEQQYHDLVESRLHAVNGIAAQRLAQRGTFDAEGVAAQIQKASDDLKKAQEAKDKGTVPQTAVNQFLSASTLPDPQKLQMFALQLNANVQLEIAELRPKMDLCVARAKA